MDILAKLREVTLSVLPIAVIASVLSFVTGVMSLPEFAAFAASCVLVILGLTLFLTGVNVGFMPVGSYLGARFAIRGGSGKIRRVMFFVLGLLFLKVGLNMLGIIDF